MNERYEGLGGVERYMKKKCFATCLSYCFDINGDYVN